ncbi:Putative ADP-ribosylation/Crystallin J1 [Planktothrix tepida]|uniref:ADP-ribosylation/Crystallin J1 n=2 Tax=Planktothrix TaxID=54304 RepID=A0A9W4G618_9CYAN|nr:MULTISPECIES: ADP-ribosylglycohydrolase family protein [Planktothrix]CAD5942442.1 Putative ADP-ribosylation/Crystallin J1 [Planktothrix pseudagardhii]CAD5968413.1 Putative ADP-ribosylation/Crystallin J1 [Planktothrix tepida]CUR35193.1 putative ADP-ribosylation/Crystallin J1 [Planktothrix tepida PCC 9214]
MKKDSLCSQFQGAILGGVLAYELGQCWLTYGSVSPGKPAMELEDDPSLQPMISLLKTEVGHLQKPLSGALSPRSSGNAGRLISQLTQSLIQYQGFDAVDYGKRVQTQTKPLFKSASEVALVGLPLGLFFHDNLRALQPLDWKELEGVAEIQDGIGLMATVIAQMLTPHPDLHRLIPNLLPRLQPKTALTAKLEQVQTLLEHRASLETAVRQLTQAAKASSATFDSENWIALALSLYCFLTTPEDYSLTVLRSLQTGYHPELTVTLSGALSGAYQGLMGIPTRWRLAFSEKPLFSQTDPKIENNSVEFNNYETELLQLAHHLFAVWSGVYHPIPSHPACKTFAQSAVATPTQMRIQG